MDVSHLILTHFLDSIGEAVNANQRAGSQYAIEKPCTFIFNLIYRDMNIYITIPISTSIN